MMAFCTLSVSYHHLYSTTQRAPALLLQASGHHVPYQPLKARKDRDATHSLALPAISLPFSSCSSTHVLMLDLPHSDSPSSRLYSVEVPPAVLHWPAQQYPLHFPSSHRPLRTQRPTSSLEASGSEGDAAPPPERRHALAIAAARHYIDCIVLCYTPNTFFCCSFFHDCGEK